MNKQSVEEFMKFVSTLLDNPEAMLKADGYTCNVESYPPDHYTMHIWVKDTDDGRQLVAIHDQATWNLDTRYRRWCSEMLQEYRELGYVEAHVRTELGKEML